MTAGMTNDVAVEKALGKTVLSVQGVSKKFCRDLKRSLFYGVQDIAAEFTGVRKDKETLRASEFWALKDVSFELKRGEALGLVGPNGSGKSTLLRIISGLIKPDAGMVGVNGTVAPLIALGAGFNPILTGRENIYTNMSILGLSRREIDERFDAVIDFAEIGDAIDAPVQTYSSGMAARLGFASAIHTHPDILLIDEVLAVGDFVFRKKCYKKLSELRESGTSFVLVSHNSQALFTVCRSAIYLLKGNVIACGGIDEIIGRYEKDMFIGQGEVVNSVWKTNRRQTEESLGLDITSLSFSDSKGNTLEKLSPGKHVSLLIGCYAHSLIEKTTFYVLIKEKSGENDIVLCLDSILDQEILAIAPGENTIRLEFPFLCLRPGVYNMKIIAKKDLTIHLDIVENFAFVVEEGTVMNRSLFYQPRRWSLNTD